MTDVETTRQLGERLRRCCREYGRQTTNRDLLAYLDATLPLLVKGSVACPVCQARRKAKTGAQRRWRAKRAYREA